MKHYLLTILIFLTIGCQPQSDSEPLEYGAATVAETSSTHNKPSIGEKIDELNGVAIYYNGATRHTDGRHISEDGYNYGLRWQCVEFVKRYYYDHLDHKMPNPWGHAKQFFDLDLTEGQLNTDRNLYQFRNSSKRKPQVNDIIVFGGKRFGHVAIISKVTNSYIEIAQQNVGLDSRARLALTQRKNRWVIRDAAVLGVLGKKR